MPVEAKTVKELREKTGLPMMDCKKALEQTDGDVERAVDELRKSGAKAVEKLQGRKADQGLVASHVSDDGRLGVLVCLRCETESVSQNQDFVDFAGELVDIVVNERLPDTDALLVASRPSGGTIAEGLTDLVNKLRENITIGGFSRLEGEAVTQYVHFDNRHAGMVSLSGGSTSDEAVATLGKDVCMHVVFSKPLVLSREDFDDGVIAKEREVLLAAAKNDPKNAKKNDEILGKIVEGQVNKFVASQCLLEQEFIKDDQRRSVGKSLEASGTGVQVTGFSYVATDAD